MQNEDLYEQARKKVKAKKAFFNHLIAYVLVIGMLYFIISYENNGGILPVVVVALSWGIGLGIHYFNAFGTEHLEIIGVDPDWEEDELRKELERLKRKRELQEEIRKERSREEAPDGLELKEIVKKPLKDEDFV